jgi:hypothetical protein
MNPLSSRRLATRLFASVVLILFTVSSAAGPIHTHHHGGQSHLVMHHAGTVHPPCDDDLGCAAASCDPLHLCNSSAPLFPAGLVHVQPLADGIEPAVSTVLILESIILRPPTHPPRGELL